MRRLVDLAARVATVDSTVLILGESGVGKERLARFIHDTSPRKHSPFIAVNCGALSDALFESELFGHARGAFTGAIHDRPGLFEAADRGTLLLDEVGEVPASLQVKLLRALQERQIRRVGENHQTIETLGPCSRLDNISITLVLGPSSALPSDRTDRQAASPQTEAWCASTSWIRLRPECSSASKPWPVQP
jgi:Sigma-54 interaction domain